MQPAGTRRLYAVNPAPLREVDEWPDPFRRFWTPPTTAPMTPPTWVTEISWYGRRAAG
jgi:hypothetical protein